MEEKTKKKKGNLPFIVWGDKRRRDPFRGQPSLWFNWCANDTTFQQDLFLKYYTIKHDYLQTREGNSFIANVNHSRRGKCLNTWNQSFSEHMACKYHNSSIHKDGFSTYCRTTLESDHHGSITEWVRESEREMVLLQMAGDHPICASNLRIIP